MKQNLDSFRQDFNKIDKRMRRNLIIGSSLILVVAFTGLVVAVSALVSMGESFIEKKMAEHKESQLQTRIEEEKKI